MMIKENIEPWSCRLNQANWSLEEDERRRCLLGTIDDMYKQRANSSGCFPILYSNKKHLSSSISFEFITMNRLVSHVSFLINWCEWTSHAQEPSGLENTMKNGIVGDDDDERGSIVKEIKSLLFVLMRCLEAMLCYSYLSKKQRCWELRLTQCVCVRTQMIVIREGEKSSMSTTVKLWRRQRRWRGSSKKQNRIDTVLPYIYLHSSFFFLSLSLSLFLVISCLVFVFFVFFFCLRSKEK